MPSSSSTMGSPGRLADVIIRASCSRQSNNMCCIPVYGRNIPTLSNPGANPLQISSETLSTRTIGLLGDNNNSLSLDVSSTYLSATSMSLTITAKGFSFLPYHSLRRSMFSRTVQMCIPPQLLAIPILPESMYLAKVGIGSPSIPEPFPSTIRYLGPQSGQHAV